MIVLITGVMAAGKSTVAQLLAEKLHPSVHLRGDMFRRSIVNGRADMGGSDPEEAFRQLELRYRLAVQTACGFAESGFTVIYQDVILGSVLAEVVASFGHVPVEVVVLCPNRETIEAREQGRTKIGYGGVTVDQLQEGLALTPNIGHWIDSSAMDAKATVAEILTRAELQPFVDQQQPVD